MKLNPRLLAEIRPYRWLFILSIVLGLAIGILAILQARQVAHLVDQVFLGRQDISSVSQTIITLLFILLVRAGAVWGGEFSASAGAQRIKQSLRDRLYARIVQIGPVILRGEDTDQRTGELVSTAIDGIEALEVYYSQYLPQIVLSALVPTSILLIVFPTDLLSGIVLLVTAPLIPIFMILIGSAAEALTRKQWKGLSRMSAYFLDILQGLTPLKTLGRSREQGEIVKRVSERYRMTTMEVLRLTFTSALALELIATLSTAVVAVEIGLRLLYGKLAFEQAFFILLLAPEFYQPLRQLGARFHAGMSGAEAANNIYAILEHPNDENRSTVGVQETNFQVSQKTIPPQISLREVSFWYPDHHLALEQATFEIPPGKMTALVGESGAGKTTLTWLLLGFIKPQAGQILIDGKSLAEIPLAEWHKQVGWVPQHPYLFSDTITANIKLASPEATDEHVIQAARLAHADEFIRQLPEGYSTQIGERGARLSAGQGQRIALARAFLKNAPLLILDEATSHLDPELDAELKESLSHLVTGRTVLVIAHRSSTVSMADQVIRLQAGRVVEIRENIPELRPGVRNVQTAEFQINSHQIDKQPELQFTHEKPAGNRGRYKRTEFRLLQLIAPFAGRIALSVFLGFATIGSGVGLMATAAYLISAAALHPSIAELQIAIVGVRFFGLSRGIFRYLERLVSHDVTFRLLASWRTWFYQALEPLAPARLMHYHSGDLLSRVIGDISALESFYVRAIAPPLVACLVAITSALWLGWIDPLFAGAIIAFFAMAGLAVPILTYRLSRKVGAEINLKRAKLSQVLVDGIQGLPDLLLNSAEGQQKREVFLSGSKLISLQGRMGGISALYNSLENLLASLAMLTILVLATMSVSQGKLAGVMLGMVALATLTCFEAMHPLPQATQILEQSRSAASRLYELVDANPAVINPDIPKTLPQVIDIEFRHVSFQYPNERIKGTPIPEQGFALHDISFSLPHGKHISIVGHSGAGKTTLLNLLLRFWDYSSGSIRLNDRELREFDPDGLRKRMAVISQNTYLFSASIRQNLLLARPGATDEEIIRAVKVAHLQDVIEALPEGYHTWIGEHGFRLSAGERQRLAIARAFLMDAPLVFLDEPTAHLDPTTEQQVLASIGEITQGRSLINITQRLVGMETMDEILVLRGGEIVERGTHGDLLSLKRQYYKMWSLYNQMI